MYDNSIGLFICRLIVHIYELDRMCLGPVYMCVHADSDTRYAKRQALTTWYMVYVWSL